VRLPAVTLALVAANVAVFVLAGPPLEAAVRWGLPAKGWGVATLFTHQFLHADAWHLAINMALLALSGWMVESRAPRIAIVPLCLLGGVAGGVTHGMIAKDGYLVGASGAVSALIGAALAIMPEARLKLGQASVRAWVAILAALLLHVGLSMAGRGEGIALWAHLGGFAFGVIAGLALRPVSKPATDSSAP
jgi:membrane associated rhomboid family serine protease